MLQGVTDKKADKLVGLAKSWLKSPEMKITSDTYTRGTYDQSERANINERTDSPKSTPCAFVLDASKDSPLLNPAIIIKNWGGQLSTLSVDGKKINLGKDFRQGIRKGPSSEDLIIWIKMEKQKTREHRDSL